MEETGQLESFAVTAPGLEEVTAGELRGLGIGGRIERGGVAWTGGLRELYAANLHLRTASRIVVTAARFRARSFIELERHLKRIEWSRFAAKDGGVVRLRVSSRKSRLYHERAIAERFERVIAENSALRATANVGDHGMADDDADGDEQVFIVRMVRDECIVRADASGSLLHRRGYRRAIAKAPLRETLAAAMLLASEWKAAPLIDPFCGSGTIPIEAALIARDIAPGLAAADRTPRDYTFQRWPGYRSELWAELVSDARARIRPGPGLRLFGSDRDAGAIEAAAANAARAGVGDDIHFEILPISAIPAPREPAGSLVTNPPYGGRIGDTGPLRNLYASFGTVARERLHGWRIAFLSADPTLARQTRLPLREALRTTNGGIEVGLLIADL